MDNLAITFAILTALGLVGIIFVLWHDGKLKRKKTSEKKKSSKGKK